MMVPSGNIGDKDENDVEETRKRMKLAPVILEKPNSKKKKRTLISRQIPIKSMSMELALLSTQKENQLCTSKM